MTVEKQIRREQLTVAGIESIASIRFGSYKSFSTKGPFRIEMNKNITLIIGRNNCGKSSLIDVIEAIIRSAYKQDLPSNMNSIALSFRLDKNIIASCFDPSVSKGCIGNESRYGMQFCGNLLSVELDKNGAFPSEQQEEEIMREHVNDVDNWKQVAVQLQRSLKNSRIRRVNAERDIVSEVENDDETVDENGNGATNIIRKFINIDAYDESIVERQILAELNRIMEPDAYFNSIRIQQIEERTDKGYKWEIFLEENGHRYAMSRSGSGLKTILLILINLYLIPKTKTYQNMECCFAFEEIENNLHPALQRRVFEYLYNYAVNNNVKILITSHSHIAINTFYGKENTKLYHVIKEEGESELIDIRNSTGRGEILDDLDVKASDLFQSNGIIWVEGPSDRIYILRWLHVFTDFTYIEGLHFQFMYYGGRLLSHYEAEEVEEKTEGLLNILTINRHAAIVMDSDKRARATQINNTKKRIKSEFLKKGSLCWITKGKEIENYVSYDAANKVYGSSLQQIGQYEIFSNYINKYDGNFSSHKVEAARKLCEYINEENSRDILDLKQQVVSLYDEIRKWN